MKLLFSNMEDCINNIPKGANISVLYYGAGLSLSYGKFLESNDKDIKIERESGIKSINKIDISEITILDKIKLAIDN